MSSFDLTAKVAVVTGAGGLLGPEHCTALATAGAHVVVTDLTAETAAAAVQKIRDAIPDACCAALPMDVTSRDSIERVKQAVLERFGRIDILINNAAIDPKMSGSGAGTEFSRVENFPEQQWQLQIDVGLSGAFWCAQVFGSWMAEHGGGVILNIASDLSVIAPDQRIYRRTGAAEAEQPVKPVTYSVIKTGLVGLTRYLATYWADRNVRVNALSPGGVFNGQSADFVARLTELIPLGRMAEKNEYHGAVQFLCSDAARYMTGQNVVMDGGRSVW